MQIMQQQLTRFHCKICNKKKKTKKKTSIMSSNWANNILFIVFTPCFIKHFIMNYYNKASSFHWPCFRQGDALSSSSRFNFPMESVLWKTEGNNRVSQIIFFFFGKYFKLLTSEYFLKFLFFYLKVQSFRLIMENNWIQMAASAGHAEAYTIGLIFKHIIDCMQLYFTNGFRI